MKAHYLAKILLDGPDVPVCLAEWANGDSVPAVCDQVWCYVSSYTVWVDEEGKQCACEDAKIVILDTEAHDWDL